MPTRFLPPRAQQGLSLVTVLVLTMASALLVFAALNSSLTQSRLSGNFQKTLNAQLQAEQAAIEQYHRLNQALITQPTADMPTLAASLLQQSQHDSDGRARQALLDSSSLTTTSLRLQTLGLRFADSRSSQQAFYRLQGSSQSQSQPFAQALIGCDGVALTGSGRISGYDSENNLASEVALSVQTVRPDADVSLSGAAPIEGDVLSRGNISLSGSALIKGKVHANGNVLLANASAQINRQVWAGGTVQINNTVTVLGEVRANTGVSISNSATLQGGIFSRQGLQITGGVRVAGQTAVLGDIRLPAWVAAGDYFQQKNQVFYSHSSEHQFGLHQPGLQVTPVPLLPVDLSLDQQQQQRRLCDPLNISQQFDQLGIPAQLPTLTVWRSWDQRRYQLTASQAQYLDKPDSSSRLLPAPSRFAGQSRSSYFLQALQLGSDAVLVVDGAVTLYLQQGMQMSGAAQLVITPGSSLTLLSHGKISFSAGSRVLTQENGDKAPSGLVRGQPVLAIYSAYQSQHADDVGVDLTGAASGLYAAIYAPQAWVQVGGSNGFSGAVVGKTVQISGAGQIRYDQALGRLQAGQHQQPGPGRRVSLTGF